MRNADRVERCSLLRVTEKTFAQPEFLPVGPKLEAIASEILDVSDKSERRLMLLQPLPRISALIPLGLS
jgi:hypothetical protein